jgi:hypothetical protein
MTVRDAVGRVTDVWQLALGAGVLAPFFRALERLAPQARAGTRHEPFAARGEAFVTEASWAAKAAFMAKLLGTDGARFSPKRERRAILGEGEELLFGGDVLFPGTLDRTTFTPKLHARLRRASALVLNLEGTLGRQAQELAPFQTWRGFRQLLAYSRDPHTTSWASRLDHLGLEALLEDYPSVVLSVANNHTFDDGPEGFDETLHHASRLSAKVVGDARDGDGSTILTIGEHRVGLFAISYGHNLREPTSRGHLHFDAVPYELRRSTVERIVSSLRRRGTTHIVASLHWGYEHEHMPSPEQRRCVALLHEAGVSAVVGHHPHLLQASECRNGHAAYFSLGDLVGGDRTVWSRLAAVASLKFLPAGLVRAELVPVVQTPYWRRQRTMLLEEAPLLEQATFASFFRWKEQFEE